MNIQLTAHMLNLRCLRENPTYCINLNVLVFQFDFEQYQQIKNHLPIYVTSLATIKGIWQNQWPVVDDDNDTLNWEIQGSIIDQVTTEMGDNSSMSN